MRKMKNPIGAYMRLKRLEKGIRHKRKKSEYWISFDEWNYHVNNTLPDDTKTKI